MLRNCAFVLGASAWLVAAGALAQESAPTDTFSANNFTPAMGPENYIMVDGALIAGHVAFGAHAFVDYSHRPLVIYEASCPGGDEENCEIEDTNEIDVVSYMFTTTLGGTVALWNAVQVGVQVPMVGTAGEGFNASRGDNNGEPITIPGGDAFVVGDPRLCVKGKIVGKGGQGFFMGGAACTTFPVGAAMAEDQKVGTDGFTGGPSLIFEFRGPKYRAGANIGYIIQPERVLLSTTSDDHLTFGAAAQYDVTSLLAITGEFTGSTQFSTQLDENPLEVRVMGELSQGDFAFGVGTGAGLVAGIGIPSFRVLGSASYAPAALDSDGDGVRDSDDNCPTDAEDLDGYLDGDGCPEVDNDMDGLLDGADKCPDEPEDPDGNEDEDGCPDRDNDGDGIQDGYDSCPDEPEDMDGDRDDDGCPDNDRDRDGVPDDVDQCPEEPEDTDGFGDDDGCPETDFDGDGIPDEEDQCPDEVEDPDGFEDDDGCPEEEEAPVRRRERERG